MNQGSSGTMDGGTQSSIAPVFWNGQGKHTMAGGFRFYPQTKKKSWPNFLVVLKVQSAHREMDNLDVEDDVDG
jgi:hypothetical protein